MLDLHTHSTISDGTFTPTELVNLAEKIKLKAVALTDHDSVGGVEEALHASKNLAVKFVPGVEMSAKLNDKSMHIVGLCVNHRDPTLTATLKKVCEMRDDRNPRLSARLQELGMEISLEEVAEVAGGKVIGRPHFAEVMISKGFVKTPHEAFRKYLGNQGIAQTPKERLSPAEIIAAIRAAGGIPILAHPDQTQRTGDALDRLVANLKNMGLEGIETFYPSYDTSQTHEYSKLAKRYDLVRSGGSDFHGLHKPKIKLGRGFGSLYVPDDLLELIEQRAGNL